MDIARVKSTVEALNVLDAELAEIEVQTVALAAQNVRLNERRAWLLAAYKQSLDICLKTVGEEVGTVAVVSATVEQV